LEVAKKHIKSILKRISRFDDEKALKELFDTYYGKLFEVSKFYVNNYSAAQEVVSDVFIKLWNNRSNLESIENIQSYLYVAAKRQSFNYIRNNKKRNHQTLDEHDDNTFVEIKSPEKITCGCQSDESKITG
jgi:RNA polymerase sigma factor (sigma-70 family)